MANNDEHSPVDISDFRYLNLTAIHESVVMLRFKCNNETAVGSGFFINIPDSPYDVILTAGHNLYYPKKRTFNTEVEVLLPHPNLRVAQPHVISIPAEHIKVSADYQKDPTLAEADYGVILIPYNVGKPRRGFGFKMTHAFAELRGQVNVSSYRGCSQPGQPVLSTGVVLVSESTENQLVYKVKTEQGNSGSPVWIAHGDDAIAVAVHNNGPASGSSGSRGSRISPKLLREVFAWAGLDTAKKIKAQNIRKKNYSAEPPSSGLYMVFAEKPFARLRRGTGSEFNVFPAQVTSDDNQLRYVLALDVRWVMFDIENDQAVLVDEPTEQCLFTKKKAGNWEKKPGIVYIILEGGKELNMDMSKLRTFDLADAQVSGLRMDKNKDSFIHFTFDPYKPFEPLPAAIDNSKACPACGKDL